MPTPLAELDGLRVRRGEQTVLGPLDAPLEPGLTGLIGPSGGGKSTLLRLLAGRLPALWRQDGALWTARQRVPRGHPLAGTVLATQDAQSGLDPRARVGSLLHWAAGPAGPRAGDRLLDSLGLVPDRIRRTRTITLSGGMRQRLLIALALLRAERLLLVDEPTSALDAANAELVMDAIGRWLAAAPEQRGALIVSHDVGLLCRRADRIWVLDQGQLIERAHSPGTAPLAPAGLRSRAARAHLATLARLRRPSAPLSATRDRAPGRSSSISFDDVRFRYRSGQPVLDGVSFELGAGETLVISGPSGSGKSTIAQLATGLLAPTRGAIRSAGEAPRPRPGRRSAIQLVFQDAVDAFNPRRTIGRALEEAGAGRDRQLAALRLLGLDPLLLEARPARLSGGERQRLGIARALLADPSVLVVDEPLAQLDPVAALAVLDALRAAQAERGCALLVLTHGVSWTASLGGDRRRLVDGTLVP